MKNELLKAVEILKDKECSIYVQGSGTINEMKFHSAIVEYDEKTNMLTIGTHLTFISLDADDCFDVNIDGSASNLQTFYLQCPTALTWRMEEIMPKTENIEVFNNEELGLQVRAILNEDGSISINAEDTAIGFRWVQTQTKRDKIYTSVRWERMNNFSAECGFPHKWGKDDYIPESLFYMLGFKAENERAVKYQQWLAIDVLPSIRKQ